MDAKLIQYLSQFKVTGENAGSYTHTSQMLPDTGKYMLKYSDMSDFWKFYSDRLWVDNENFKSGLSEKPNEYMPILADIDLAFEYKEGHIYDKHFYTQNQLINTVKIYIDVLKYCIQDYNPDHFVCFVLEKSKPYVSGVRVKNGFHLHFPFLFMAHHEQDVQIIPRVMKQMEDLDIFKDIGINNSGQVIDKSCTKKHWLMYGSRKDSKLEAYKLTKILDINCQPISLSTVMDRVKLVDYEEDEISMVLPSNMIPDASREDIEYFLPCILSVHPYNRVIYKCKPSINVIIKDIYKKPKDFKNTFENMTLSQSIEVCKKLMVMISDSRATNRDTWIEIGWILYNITQGYEEGLRMWIEFSKRTTANNCSSESECVWQWERMELRGFTIGSLRHYASSDSPEQYKLFVSQETLKRINDSLHGGHVDLAKQLHDVLGNKFVCASIDKHLWFEFKIHRWFSVERGISLRARINTELVPKYSEEVSKCYIGDHADPQNDLVQMRAKKLNTIIVNLKTAGFKDGIMRECTEQFYNGDFLSLLDNNKYLLGFNNGVLDLKTCEFRSGKPDDYVSMTTGYDYREFFDEDPEVLEVEMILQKFFPDTILRKYFMQYCARLLKGGNDAKTFVCMTGVGDNGKSMAIELLEKALGQYMIKLPTTLLTGKRGQSSQASPELARTHGVRFAVLQEPDGHDTINAGILKELTGNDSMYVRGLFQSGKDIKMMLKLCLVCNKLPRLSAEEQAVWNRTRVLDFESRFPKNNIEVPSTWEEQLKRKIFYRDDTISERFDRLKCAFMWIMFRTYKECMQTGWMPEPTRVMEATNAYRKNNDYMLQFITENIKEDVRPGNNLLLTDIYNNFKSWFAMSFQGTKTPTKNDLRDDLIKRWGPMKANRWIGYRFRTADDDVHEGSARRLEVDDFTDGHTDEETDGDTDLE